MSTFVVENISIPSSQL